MKEIMDCLTPSVPVREVKVMKGTQLGFTEAANNFIGCIIDIYPGPTAMFMPNEDLANKHAELRLNPSIESTPVLREKIKEAKGKETKDKIAMKIYPGGYFVLATAASISALSSLPFRYLILDEIDKYKVNVGGQGNPVKLAEKRVDTYKSVCKIYKLSTPSIKGQSNIEKEMIDSDQRYYYLPCPYCGFPQHLTFKDIIFEKNNRYELTSDVYYKCKNCRKLIEEYNKTAMMDFDVAKWKPRNPGHPHRGFFLPSWYSPVGWLSWVDIVKEFLEAERDNDNEKRKVVVNTRFAELWEEGENKITDGMLISRRENYGPELPNGVLLLGCSVDVQGDRLEAELNGYGFGEENWSIEYKIFTGDPAFEQVWTDLDDYLLRTWKHKQGISLPISVVAIDSAYKTDEVYAFVKPRQIKKVHGFIQKVIAIRGGKEVTMPLINRPTKVGINKSIFLYTLGVNQGKDILNSRLQLKDHGPGCIHFPLEYDDQYFVQLTNEVKVKEKGVERWKKKSEGAKVEALDIKVYGLAALRILNPNWEKVLVNQEKRIKDFRERKEENTDEAQPKGRRVISPGRKKGWVNKWR